MAVGTQCTVVGGELEVPDLMGIFENIEPSRPIEISHGDAPILDAIETIRETSDLLLPPEVDPGSYELWVGLYLLETGERLPVQNDASGENAVVIPLETLP